MPSKRWFTRPPIILFIAAILIVIVAGALVTRTIDTGFTFRVLTPDLQLSISTLPFPEVNGDGIKTLPSFTITNTGNLDLTLSYSYGGATWPAWATIHLAITNYANLGGANLNGVLLVAGAPVTVFPSLEIVGATGAGQTFNTVITLGGT